MPGRDGEPREISSAYFISRKHILSGMTVSYSKVGPASFYRSKNKSQRTNPCLPLPLSFFISRLVRRDPTLVNETRDDYKSWKRIEKSAGGSKSYRADKLSKLKKVIRALCPFSLYTCILSTGAKHGEGAKLNFRNQLKASVRCS